MYWFLPFYFCTVLLKLPYVYFKNTSLVLHLGKHTYQENYISPDNKMFWFSKIYFTHISPASDQLWWLYREEVKDGESNNDHSVKKITFRPEIILSDFSIKGTNLKLIKNINAYRNALPSGHTPSPFISMFTEMPFPVDTPSLPFILMFTETPNPLDTPPSLFISPMLTETSL